MRKKLTNKKSFTLIELLITTSIFSVMILSVYSTFNTGLLSSQRIEAALGSYQTARRIFNRLGLDLKNSFAYSSEDTKFIGKNNELSFFTLVSSNFSSVSYKLEDGKLLRIFKKNSESLKEEKTVRPRIMSSGIKEMIFEYSGSIQDDGNYDWTQAWGEKKEEKKKLPLAVKIELTLIEKLSRQKERDVKFSQTFFLPLAG